MILLAFLFFCAVIAVLFFRVIDAALEIDDLKSSGQLLGKDFDHLQAIANASLASTSCSLSVAEFERIVKERKIPMNPWNGASTLAGEFKVKRNGPCIIHIELSM